MRVAALHLHPVKSARGVPVRRAEVGPAGFRHDRRWMIVDADGRFLSQREDARLGRIVPALDGPRLVLRGPGAPDLILPAAPDAGERRTVTVWGERVEALDGGDEAEAFLAAALGREARLAYQPDDALRPVDPDHAGPADRVSFADGFPYLLTTTASLDDLNARAGTRLAMERFRPNLVVEGSAPYAEDGWARIEVGSVPFRVAKPCARCVVPTIDPDTLEAGPEPLRTLAGYRRRADGKVLFGQNLLPDGVGTVSVGDPVVATPRDGSRAA